jgi:hypothetical protein
MEDYPTWEQWKGAVRVEEVKEYYEARGYKVSVYPISDHENVDAIAENKHEVIALEITNWNINQTLKVSGLEGWLRHWDKVLREMNCRGDTRRFIKRVVYSYPENIQFVLEYLRLYNIELQCCKSDNESDVVIKHSKNEKGRYK